MPDATERCEKSATHVTGYGLIVCAWHAMASDRLLREDGRSRLIAPGDLERWSALFRR
jgi:hypothetical protein